MMVRSNLSMQFNKKKNPCPCYTDNEIIKTFPDTLIFEQTMYLILAPTSQPSMFKLA